MAVTRIHPIKATVQRAVNYIINPEKTDDFCLVDSYLCAPEIAESSFDFYNSRTRKRINSVPAYHLIQSFFPGEVSYDEAHKIGIEFADKVLGNGHAYVVSTHIDKGHVHNHIIFCSANIHDASRFNNSHDALKRIQDINDLICEEHGLSVVREKKDIGKNYLEWKAIKNGTSWKEKIRNDIDAAIKQSFDYESFLKLMRAMGYEINGEELSPDARKYITFKAPGMKRSARGKAGSLGRDYTKESIDKRIKEQIRSFGSSPMDAPSIINTNRQKFQDNTGLFRWAEKKNLKNASSLYSRIGSMAELRKQIEQKEKFIFSYKGIVDKNDEKLKNLTEVMAYVDAYQSNLVYQSRYERSVDPERYYKNHRPQLDIFSTAKDFLEAHGINVDKADFGRMTKDYESLKANKEKTEAEFARAQKDLNKLRSMERDLTRYMKNEGRKPGKVPSHNEVKESHPNAKQKGVSK